MPAALLGRSKMVIWEDGDDVWGPGKHDVCMLCHGALRAPFIMWHAWRGNTDHRFICSRCCADMAHGFPLDLKAMATAKRLQDLGFKPEEKICNDDRLAPMFDIQH
jgi:hypothetical protein